MSRLFILAIFVCIAYIAFSILSFFISEVSLNMKRIFSVNSTIISASIASFLVILHDFACTYAIVYLCVNLILAVTCVLFARELYLFGKKKNLETTIPSQPN